MSQVIIRNIILFLLFAGTFLDLFSQSKSDLIRFGDDAYDKGNFASAAYFYTKAITISNAGIKEVVFPYDLKHSNRDFDEAKVKKAKQDSTISDSLYTDSLITVAEQEYVFDSAGAHLNLSYREMEFSEILYKLGDSYRMDHNYELAEEWLEKAIAYPTIKYPLAKFWYGDILMNNEKYEDARNIFSEFITETISEELSRYRNIAKTKMRSCTFAIKKSGNAPGIDVWVADSVINKGVSNFGTVYFGSESDIMFTTTNPIGKKEKGTESGLSCDIEIVMGYKEDNPDVEMLPAPVRSPFHEASGAYNNKDNRLYFTHWEDDVCGIYYSNYFQGAWMAPWTMAKINKSGYKTMNPTLSKDRKTLYFSSDMPGGQGGMDIWYCTLDRWGDATEPVNMGSIINSPGDEVTPYLHPRSGALYFSSNGHVGFGGYDVFVSKFNEEYGWMRPINLEKPINSSKDDTYYILDSEGKSGYLSSDRIGCEDCAGGNCMKIFEYDKGIPTFFLDGIVFNAMTDEIIPNAKIKIVDVKEDTVMYQLDADESGYYSLQLKADMVYFIKAQKPQYFADANSVSTMGYTESSSFMRDLFLNPIPGEEIVIEGIEYDYDKATLRPYSIKVLDKLFSFLELNDNLMLELHSHTDNRGTHDYNVDLSQQRAESCVKYLVDKGIDQSRLKPVGYGETRPKVKDAETEEEHQRNRRTAFTVLGQDFKWESEK